MRREIESRAGGLRAKAQWVGLALIGKTLSRSKATLLLLQSSLPIECMRRRNESYVLHELRALLPTTVRPEVNKSVASLWIDLKTGRGRTSNEEVEPV